MSNMNKKYITLNYQEYLEMQQNIETLVGLLSYIYFCKDNKLKDAKRRIEEKNKIYNWWF